MSRLHENVGAGQTHRPPGLAGGVVSFSTDAPFQSSISVFRSALQTGGEMPIIYGATWRSVAERAQGLPDRLAIAAIGGKRLECCIA